MNCNYFVNGTQNCGGSGGGTPTPTSTGNGISVPGTIANNIGSVSNGQTLSYTINAS